MTKKLFLPIIFLFYSLSFTSAMADVKDEQAADPCATIFDLDNDTIDMRCIKVYKKTNGTDYQPQDDKIYQVKMEQHGSSMNWQVNFVTQVMSENQQENSTHETDSDSSSDLEDDTDSISEADENEKDDDKCVSKVSFEDEILYMPCVMVNEFTYKVIMKQRGNSSSWEVEFVSDDQDEVLLDYRHRDHDDEEDESEHESEYESEHELEDEYEHESEDESEHESEDEYEHELEDETEDESKS